MTFSHGRRTANVVADFLDKLGVDCEGQLSSCNFCGGICFCIAYWVFGSGLECFFFFYVVLYGISLLYHLLPLCTFLISFSTIFLVPFQKKKKVARTVLMRLLC